jgi:hypothetical protein
MSVNRSAGRNVSRRCTPSINQISEYDPQLGIHWGRRAPRIRIRLRAISFSGEIAKHRPTFRYLSARLDERLGDNAFIEIQRHRYFRIMVSTGCSGQRPLFIRSSVIELWTSAVARQMPRKESPASSRLRVLKRALNMCTHSLRPKPTNSSETPLFVAAPARSWRARATAPRVRGGGRRRAHVVGR